MLIQQIAHDESLAAVLAAERFLLAVHPSLMNLEIGSRAESLLAAVTRERFGARVGQLVRFKMAKLLEPGRALIASVRPILLVVGSFLMVAEFLFCVEKGITIRAIKEAVFLRRVRSFLVIFQLTRIDEGFRAVGAFVAFFQGVNPSNVLLAVSGR